MTRSLRFGRGGRPWTRAAVLCQAAHIGYEAGAGVGMPLASRLGFGPTGALWGITSAAAWRAAGRAPRSRDPAFALVDGLCLAAVLAHLASWPHERGLRAPCLRQCEGLDGRAMPAYNLLLYAGGATAAAGLRENRRGAVVGMLPLVLVPRIGREQHGEVARLRARARETPRWWNRRLRRDIATP